MVSFLYPQFFELNLFGGHIEPRVRGFPGISATDTAVVKDNTVRGQDDSFCGDWDRWEINGRL